MKPKVYKINKLYNGLASVRSYIVHQCIQQGRDLIIRYGNQEMYIPYRDLSAKTFQIHHRVFLSRYNGRPYQLIDFRWQPQKEEENALFKCS